MKNRQYFFLHDAHLLNEMDRLEFISSVGQFIYEVKGTFKITCSDTGDISDNG